ncbi:MAG TPA: cell division protein FtsA [bacterium]|nr:cell division protein FtsA [bacterium]
MLDMDEFKKNLDHALSEAERMTGEQITNVYLTLSGPVIESVTNVGIVSVLGTEITEDDVNRSLDMAQNGVDLTNRSVLKVIPETFTIDREPGLKNPVGMAAKKLEVRAHIYSIGSNVLANIQRAVGDVGVGILDMYPSVITSGEAVLSKRQKELGVTVIEIGSSSTNIAVYEEGALLFSSVVPVGGEHVTSDIALGFRVSIDLAERLKLEVADLAFSPEDDKDVEIDLAKFDKNESHSVSKKFLTEIVRARYLEIFHLVNAELKRAGRDGMLPEGAVLTGGGAKIR